MLVPDRFGPHHPRAAPPASLLASLCAIIFVLTSAFSGPGAAAADLKDALAQFATGDFDATAQGIAAVAVSGDPRAATILSALKDGRLLYSSSKNTVLLRDADGRLLDAATGSAAPEDPDVEAVEVNNRLRRAIDAAIGSLTLMAPDPARRRDAAEAVFKSREAAALEAVTTALARETDPGVRRALNQAHAAIVLSADDGSAEDKLAALAVIAARGDRDAIALLTGLPEGTPPAVRNAAAAATAAIARDLAVWDLAQNAWYGLSLGSVLLLAAIGLAITFGVMGVINMAHGEMVMIGAYVTFAIQEVARTTFQGHPEALEFSLAAAVPAAFVIAGLAGIIIERGAIRFLYGRPLETLLATFGLSLILQQAVRTAFGPTNREVSTPAFMSGAFEAGHLSVTWNRLWIIVFALLVFAALAAILRFTRLGLEMRAVTQNRAMAASMGIRTGRIDALTFGLGSGIAGIAGVALSQIDNVSPNLGQGYIIDSFMVVVFGGVGNLWGTLLGAFTLGIADKFLEPVAGAVLGKIAILVLLILFIQKRPRGLFALRGRAVEA